MLRKALNRALERFLDPMVGLGSHLEVNNLERQ